MFYFSSERVASRLRSEPGGVWIDSIGNPVSHWLIAKLQTCLIREIDAGTAIDLNAWVIESDGHTFAAFGLTVHDDAVNPKVAYGACRTTDEIDGLRAVLGACSVNLQLHNESELPLFNATCELSPSRAAKVLAALPTGEYPAGDGFILRGKALDILEASMRSGAAPDNRILASCTLPLNLTSKERMTASVIGVHDFTLDDPDQGGELEKLTFQLFEALFPFGTYYSPQRKHNREMRELCDVLAISRVREVPQEGVYIIQNKGI